MIKMSEIPTGQFIGGIAIGSHEVFHKMIAFRTHWWERGFTVKYILDTNGRAIAGGRESKEGKQTIFFTPLTPSREKTHEEEEPSGDLSVLPRKTHHHSYWKHDQDAVCWVKWCRVQYQGLRFWHTKPDAAIENNFVLANCLYKASSQNGDRTSFERLSTIAPRVTLRSRWHSQQKHFESALSGVWKQM